MEEPTPLNVLPGDPGTKEDSQNDQEPGTEAESGFGHALQLRAEDIARGEERARPEQASRCIPAQERPQGAGTEAGHGWGYRIQTGDELGEEQRAQAVSRQHVGG